MTTTPANGADFVPGLEGVVAFHTAIAEPDRDGGSLRYRGVDIDDLVGNVGFEDVWALLVDDEFGAQLPIDTSGPAFSSGDVRVDVQASLPLLAPARGFGPLLDITDEQARDHLAQTTAAVLSYAAHSARGDRPAVSTKRLEDCSTVVERFMTSWLGEPSPEQVQAIDAYWVSAAEHGMNASTFTARVVASTAADVPACITGAIGSMSGPLHGGAPARVLPMVKEVEANGDPFGLVSGILDRKERLMGFGHRVYRAEDPRARVLRRTCRELNAPAIRSGGRPGAGCAGDPARTPTGPGDRDQRRVLGSGDPGFCRGTGRDDARHVHLRPHRRLERTHPGAEAARPDRPAVRDLRRAPAAQTRTGGRLRGSRRRRLSDPAHVPLHGSPLRRVCR